MFGLGGAQNGTGMTFASYWESLSIGFKCLIVATLSLGILGTFTSVFELTLANILYYSIHRLQLWRLFTSFMVDSSIINVIFNLYLLNNLLPDLERRYSTAYLITEILLQTLYCNTVLVLFGEVFVILGLASSKAFVSFGLTNLMFIFMWQKVAINPQQMTRFCCFPCIMPLKYLPWCFLALLVLLGGGQTALIGCLLGYYQHIIRKKTLLPISQAVYIKIQKWLPHFIKGHSGFISISSVKANFNQISSSSSHSQRISSSQDTEEMSDQVSAGGAGVVIGGGSAQNADYRRHWMQQEYNADQSLSQESVRPFKNDQSSSSVQQLKQKQTSQLI